MLKAMDRRKHNEFATEAAFHGIKVPMMHNEQALSAADAGEPFDAMIEKKILEEAQQRLRARHGR